MTAAETCSAFCPASPTTIFSGDSIDDANAPDGSLYADLPNAFAYRQRIVENCTCNGKDPFGLASVDVDQDPTLRPGDIVAKSTGLMVYSGSGPNDNMARYTPIKSYSAMPADIRHELSSMKVKAVPVARVAVSPTPTESKSVTEAKDPR